MSHGETSTTPTPQVDLGDPQLTATINDGLSQVEQLLRVELSGGEDFITDKVQHLAVAGGK